MPKSEVFAWTVSHPFEHWRVCSFYQGNYNAPKPCKMGSYICELCLLKDAPNVAHITNNKVDFKLFTFLRKLLEYLPNKEGL